MKQRRVFTKAIKSKVWVESDETKWIPNPRFSKKVMEMCQLKGWQYNEPLYIEVPANGHYEYETEEEAYSQLEFEITCSHCKTKVWRKKSFTKFCSDSCKSMSWRAKKETKEAKTKEKP